VYSAKHREHQLVDNSALFFNSCYFHNVDFFPLWYAPLCPRNWGKGHNTNLGGR